MGVRLSEVRKSHGRNLIIEITRLSEQEANEIDDCITQGPVPEGKVYVTKEAGGADTSGTHHLIRG